MSEGEHARAPEAEAADTLRLGDFLPYRLSVLSNTVSRAIAAEYDRAFGLNIWQWRCMAVLGEAPGLTAREVTERTAMDKVAVSRALSALESAGRLRREADRRDARASRLYLTAAGTDTYKAIIPIARRHEHDLLAGLTHAERQMLGELLARLARAAAPDRQLW